VGAKSIAAYRVGLRLPAAPPTADALVAALAGVRPDAAGAFRVAEPVVNGWLAWTAVELGMPLQFHVGYGDSDLDLAECDPLLLTPFLRATAAGGTPVLLLHNYPFHRHAAYLAQVFPHVFVDVGLATHNSGALSTALIGETLELAPFGKLLFSSDAFGLAELHHLGALLFRRGLAAVLERLVDAGEMTGADADRVGALVARENARRAYRV
jgi:predicted TIM-barrel fold metal-dependent hydrolase